jgi:hypothetical protein
MDTEDKGKSSSFAGDLTPVFHSVVRYCALPSVKLQSLSAVKWATGCAYGTCILSLRCKELN